MQTSFMSMWQSWSNELQTVCVKLSAFGATRAQTQLSCVRIDGQSLQLLIFMIDNIKINQELCKQKHLDTMQLLNQHFSSKTWTNFEAFSLTGLRLIFIRIQEDNIRSLEYQGLKRQRERPCALKVATDAYPDKQENIVSSLIQNGQPKVRQTRRHVVAAWNS